MKIQSQFRNVNLFNTSNINNSKNNISIKEQINIPEGNSIKVDISKEEDLAKLNEAYENHVNTFEEMIHIEEKSDLLLEKELRGTAWGSTSSLAQEFLAKLDEKRANPEYIPNNIAERMINAGKTFQTNFSKLQNSNTKYGPSIN